MRISRVPIEQYRQCAERQQHDRYGQEVTRRERREGACHGSSAALRQTGCDSERPAHPGVQPVIDAAREDRGPERRLPIHPTLLTPTGSRTSSVEQSPPSSRIWWAA